MPSVTAISCAVIGRACWASSSRMSSVLRADLTGVEGLSVAMTFSCSRRPRSERGRSRRRSETHPRGDAIGLRRQISDADQPPGRQRERARRPEHVERVADPELDHVTLAGVGVADRSIDHRIALGAFDLALIFAEEDAAAAVDVALQGDHAVRSVVEWKVELAMDVVGPFRRVADLVAGELDLAAARR